MYWSLNLSTDRMASYIILRQIVHKNCIYIYGSQIVGDIHQCITLYGKGPSMQSVKREKRK